MAPVLAKLAAHVTMTKLAAIFGVGLFASVTTGNDVIIAGFTLLNTLLLVIGNILTQRNRSAISGVQDTAEKTFQSTTHAANAAEGAARSAAISTIVASKHLGIDLRDEDIAQLTSQLQQPVTQPPAPPIPENPPPSTAA